MRKLKRWGLAALLAVCAILFVGYYITAEQSRDTVPPVITLREETVSMSVHKDHNSLLNGVTAVDDRDGDVTASVLVEDISPIDENRQATVTYAAFDAAGNVAKARGTIVYTDYQRPKFAFSAPLIFRSGITVDLYDYVAAYDPLDGNLSDRLRTNMVDGGHDLSAEGIHQVELRVTNSMGDTVRLVVPVQVYDPADFNAVVELTDYLIYLPQGSDFDPQRYLDGIYTGRLTYPADHLRADGAEIRVESDVDTSVPGTYSTTYTIFYAGHSAIGRLVTVVEESYAGTSK